MVIFRPMALGVGAVSAGLRLVVHRALVKGNAEIPQALGDQPDAALHLALFIGILNAQDDPAAGGVGHPLGDHGGKYAADVQKARGAGGEAGHLRALLQVSGRKLLLQQLVGRLGHMGKQKLGKTDGIGHLYVTPK